MLESAQGISVLFDGHTEPLIFEKNRRALIELLDGSSDIKALWEGLQKQKSSIKLSEIYLTVEKLKKTGAIEGAAEAGLFESNWLAYSVFKFLLIHEKKVAASSRGGFLLVSSAILLASLLSIYFNYSDLKVHGYLQLGNSFVYSVPLLFLLFSGLGLLKGLLKGSLILLCTGSWPTTVFCYRAMMFDLEIDESSILIETPLFRRLYQLTKTLCFLFLGAVTAVFVSSDLGRQAQITALLMTFVWLNPLRKSEFSQAVSSFFDEDEIRHLIPFLRKKSLAGFSVKKSDPGFEKKLIVFSSLSLIWIFLFFDFTQNLISANFGFWENALTAGGGFEMISAGLLAVGIIGLFFSLLIDFLITVGSNIFSQFSKKISQLRQRRRPVELGNFSKTQLFDLLAGLSFFNDVEKSKLQMLTDRVKVKAYPKGTPIVLEGDLALEMYVLLEGRARVEKETASGFKQKFATLTAGAVFGEVGLSESRNRTADVISDTEVTLAIISKKDFDAVFEGDSTTSANSLKQKILLSRYLANSAVFKALPLETLQLFIRQGTFENFEIGTKIVAQDSLEKDFYLLLEGKVAVLRDGRELSRLAQGDFFGEIALFQNVPRTADVVATEKGVLLKLNKDAFWNVLSENMELIFSLENISHQRSGNS